MNKIEELEARIRSIETLLGVNPENVQDTREFWDPSKDQIMPVVHPYKVAYRCAKGHMHDTVLEAKGCQEE